MMKYIVGLILIVGAFFGGYWYNAEGGNNVLTRTLVGENAIEEGDDGVTESDFKVFWDTWELVQEKYPFDDEEPTDQERIYAATAGMVDSFGDPHTVFLSPQDTEIFAGDVKGEFGGVGMEVGMRDNAVTVIAPLKESPAENAGILAGDIIYTVDGDDVYGHSVDETISLIRGEIGTPVVLEMLREGETEPLEFTVVRDTISIPVLDYELSDDGVFIISFYSFTANSFEKFVEALLALEADKENVKGLVIDVRSNPGGYLDAVINIASLFLPEGTPIVREKGTEEEVVYRSAGQDVFEGDDLPIAILIDGGSASASEILAGALMEHDHATSIGQTTFGKGSVQEFIPGNDGSSLKVTVAKWFTPNGISIDDEGVVPDIEIEYTRENYENEEDPQMDRAVEFVLE